MTTTHSGVDSTDGALSIDGAADAFLNRWKDADSLSDQDRGATTPDRNAQETGKDEEDEQNDEDLDFGDEDQDDENEGSDQDDENDNDDADELVEAADEAVVKLTVDGEERKVPVKDLKRLYGQEQSLTRKSQEVAQKRKAAEEEGARYTTAMQALVAKANAKYEPYAKVDWEIARSTLTPEEFVALRQEAKAAYEDVQFLQTEVDTTFKAAQETRAKEMKEAAQEAVAILSDPEKGIPNWNQQTYDSIISYAVTNGLDEGTIKQVTDANIIKLLHKAMSYDAAKERAKTKRKATSAKRVMKSKTKSSRDMSKPNADAEMKALQKSGKIDDAANAFLARWNAESDD